MRPSNDLSTSRLDSGTRICAALVLLAALSFLQVGCATNATRHDRGPVTRATVTREPWDFNGTPGIKLRSAHYLLYTTISPDDELVERLPQLLEGALTQYSKLTPTVALSQRPMECYVFMGRSQWAEFTRRHTGSIARVYLQITRGGYTVGDRFVAYDLGDHTTLAVAAHEGWHQFSARHFKSRLPPFLEEGLSCLFENVEFEGQLPRWNLRVNQKRVMSLRRSIERRHLFDLGELIVSHAGQIVSRPGQRVEAFYAQSWAFARFMLEAEEGRYRPVFDRLVADAIAGQVRSTAGSLEYDRWDPSDSKGILEHYFGLPLSQIEERFNVFCRWVAYKEFPMHWEEGE